MANGEKHNPDEAEIRRECEKIRATWSRAEERRRRCFQRQRVETPVVPIAELRAATG